MTLYGAIETLHDTEQNRTHPSRNILRDRQLKVKVQGGSVIAAFFFAHNYVSEQFGNYVEYDIYIYKM